MTNLHLLNSIGKPIRRESVVRFLLLGRPSDCREKENDNAYGRAYDHSHEDPKKWK